MDANKLIGVSWPDYTSVYGTTPRKKRRRSGRDRAVVFLTGVASGQMLRAPLLPVVAGSLHWTPARGVSEGTFPMRNG